MFAQLYWGRNVNFEAPGRVYSTDGNTYKLYLCLFTTSGTDCFNFARHLSGIVTIAPW